MLTACYTESTLIWVAVYSTLVSTFIGAMLYVWLIKTGDKE